MRYPNELRIEFPRCDLGYVRENAPSAIKLAQLYNDYRAVIDPADEETILVARRVKERLIRAVEGN